MDNAKPYQPFVNSFHEPAPPISERILVMKRLLAKGYPPRQQADPFAASLGDFSVALVAATTEMIQYQ